jgi:excisionase family DNA binding protein
MALAFVRTNGRCERMVVPNKRKVRVMAGDYEILTVKEVCKLLHVHPSTIYKLTKTGKIPAFRIGTDWRFRSDVIERWTAEQMDVLQ